MLAIVFERAINILIQTLINEAKFMNYDLLLNQYRALLIGKFLTDLSNTTAFLNDCLKNINWVGFYLLESDQKLYLGPFQGKVACTTIPLNKGVCGHAATLRQTTVVHDVHQFKGHIACDSRSNAEVVIPMIQNDLLIGVLDVDSPTHSRFNDPNEILFLEKVVSELMKLQNH